MWNIEQQHSPYCRLPSSGRPFKFGCALPHHTLCSHNRLTRLWFRRTKWDNSIYVFYNSPSIDDSIFTLINKTPVKHHYTYIGPWSCNCSLWSAVTQSDPVSNQAVVTDKSNARDWTWEWAEPGNMGKGKDTVQEGNNSRGWRSER